MRSQVTTFVCLALILMLASCEFQGHRISFIRNRLDRAAQKVQGISDFLSDLESYTENFKDRINSIIHKTLVQTMMDETTGRLYNVTYSEFTFGEPALVVGDAKVALSFDFPHFDVKISGIRFNIAYDFLIGPAEENGYTGHAYYSVSDLTLEFGDEMDISNSHATISDSLVEIEGIEQQGEVAAMMNDFLTEKIVHSLNEPFCDGEEEAGEPEEFVQRRNLRGSSFPSISLDLDKIINRIKEDPLTIEIEDEIDSAMDHVEDNLDRAKELQPTCEQYEDLTDKEVESHKNFYELMDTVYVHAVDDAEEKEEEPEDIFFWFDEIKMAILNDADSNYVPSCRAEPDGADAWQIETCLKYRDVMRDYLSGTFLFEDVKPCKLRQIQKKNEFASDVKKDMEKDFASLQKILDKAEKKANKATDKAIKKLGDLLKFP